MAVQHAGQVQNQLLLEEHEGSLNAKRVYPVSGAGLTSLPTIFAVVNIGAGGGTTTVTPVGLTTLAPSPNYIGLTTTQLGAGDKYIGLVTSTQNGLVTLAPSPNAIGFVTAILSGNVTATSVGLQTLAPSPNFIGLVTVAGIGTLTLSDPKGFIGLVTNVQSGLTTLAPSPNFIGLVTVAGIGTLTLSDPKGFIGLVTTVASGNTTVLSRNAGTNKTLKSLPITLSTGSQATIFVPTNTFNITQVLINSNATVRLNLKSGATYLTGNASLGVNLSPTGGWVESGSPDSPIYLGLAAQAAIVVEKADSGGTVAQIGGHITYFDE